MNEQQRSTIQDATSAQEMAATQGWVAMQEWIEGLIRGDLKVIENGARSWDEYQQAVGRLKSLRLVLERPAYLVGKGNEVVSGGDYE